MMDDEAKRLADFQDWLQNVVPANAIAYLLTDVRQYVTSVKGWTDLLVQYEAAASFEIDDDFSLRDAMVNLQEQTQQFLAILDIYADYSIKRRKKGDAEISSETTDG